MFKAKQTKMDCMILSKEELCQGMMLSASIVECNQQTEMLHSVISVLSSCTHLYFLVFVYKVTALYDYN